MTSNKPVVGHNPESAPDQMTTHPSWQERQSSRRRTRPLSRNATYAHAERSVGLDDLRAATL